ncbi:class III extradiol dioxygenase family protein [Phenylobacterium soli]|uniref:Protocatechuate 3,4-dioxygenase n=1 Tax=Phenylobacterium soli TaxID=2170551 RepID=A0A328AB48_9CAUL|nr:class III extradiol dioxygenase family protein [Phenylobacterium soli]RAK51799.1 protocatechuate 3,4-dioxygenase [Phenylobacterium soli]
MAKILGGIGTSHVPAIGRAIARGEQQTPYWAPFFGGYPPAQRWLAKTRPDVAVVFYNDHGLNFFLDKMPTFAIGAAAEYRNADEGWGLSVAPPVAGDPELSWAIVEGVVARDFDPTTCQEMLIDHAVTVPLQLLWPDHAAPPVRIVPIAINTVQHPLPSARRCFALGQAVGAAIEAFPRDLDVVVIGTGGLSHQLDGERAGFLNAAFDRECLEKIVDEPEALTRYTNDELVELAGTQGIELLMWLAMRGALRKPVRTHQHYHAPVSNTGGALLVMDETPGAAALAA